MCRFWRKTHNINIATCMYTVVDHLLIAANGVFIVKLMFSFNSKFTIFNFYDCVVFALRVYDMPNYAVYKS